MFDEPVVYIDIETTGGSYRTSRVLEVAAIRVDQTGTHEFSSLINPEIGVPRSITGLTGINDGMVADAPSFADIADELFEILDGAIFIAHNVRFDYSFLKAEFASVGIVFNPKLFCTVRLSRALYQNERGHSLAKLIDRHEIPVLDRHRAQADAYAIKYFAELAFGEHGKDTFDTAVARQLKTQYLPPNLDLEELESIGEVPGVYIFKDENGQPLYVGKSVTLKSRIMSHFRDTSARELKISQNVHHVETRQTGSDIAALVLESRLVKQLQPLYNRQLRRVSKYALLTKAITMNGYANLTVTSGTIDESSDLSAIYGVYPTRTKAKARVVELTRTFQLCPKLMGIEKGAGACFSFSLGTCKGACIEEEPVESYNRRFELALERSRLDEWPYERAVEIPINDLGERVVIDNWMILGYVDSSGERTYDETDATFDVDEYKIIRRFLRENAHRITTNND